MPTNEKDVFNECNNQIIWKFIFLYENSMAKEIPNLMKIVKQIIGILIFVLPSAYFFGCSTSEDLAKENQTKMIRSESQSFQGEVQSENYIIRHGDQIQLSVWSYTEFNTVGPVKETGTFTVPLVGEILVAGLTKEQFTEQLTKKLAEYIQGEVKLNITITSTISQKVAVLGAVVRQDNYPASSDVSLLEMLTTAGGTTTESDLHHVKILRGGQNRQPIDVDLAWYMENGNIESIPIIRPGDVIYIPKKGNVIRELSDFLRDAIFIFGFFRVFN